MNKAVIAAVLCVAALAGCRRAPPAPLLVADVSGTQPSLLVPSTAGTVPSGALGLGGVPVLASIGGTYRGQSVLVRNDGRCARGGAVALRVGDAVRFRVNRSVPELVAPVASDGFFAADNGVSTLRGQFLPGRMEFDAGTLECGYRYVLTRTA